MQDPSLDEVREALARAAKSWWAAPTVEMGPDGFRICFASGLVFVVVVRRS
jgi:hypothetical protein